MGLKKLKLEYAEGGLNFIESLYRLNSLAGIKQWLIPPQTLKKTSASSLAQRTSQASSNATAASAAEKISPAKISEAYSNPSVASIQEIPLQIGEDEHSGDDENRPNAPGFTPPLFQSSEGSGCEGEDVLLQALLVPSTAASFSPGEENVLGGDEGQGHTRIVSSPGACPQACMPPSSPVQSAASRGVDVAPTEYLLQTVLGEVRQLNRNMQGLLRQQADLFQMLFVRLEQDWHRELAKMRFDLLQAISRHNAPYETTAESPGMEESATNSDPTI
ncbi:uncharacterized protein [Aquarana catesbeiana]|uniref:uncharacterized protein n=1 Tax=Aquarana catesbeiana TaxID=8400 RepID=UPI003CC93318